MRFTSAISTLFLLAAFKLAAGLPMDTEIAERAVVVVVETVIVTKTAGAPDPQNTGGRQDGQDREDRGPGGYGGWGWGHHKQQSSVTPQPQSSVRPQPEPQPQPQTQTQTPPEPSPQSQAPGQTSAGNDTPQPSAPPNGGSSGISADNAKVLELHNAYRRTKCSGLKDLVWDETAANLAQNWAQGCRGLVHSSGEARTVNGIGYGENIGWSSNPDAQGADLFGMWTDEDKDYIGNGKGQGDKVVGHYTQVVWAATTGLGCALQNCGSGGALFICNYAPGGNNGAYVENVDNHCMAK